MNHLIIIQFFILYLTTAFNTDYQYQIVIDTDIGTFMDDTFALSYILSLPNVFNIQLILTDSHDTYKRASLLAKFLDTVNRTDIPIGIGKKVDNQCGPQCSWADDYSLSNYPGKIYENGVQKLHNLLLQRSIDILLVLAPPTNIAELLSLANPDILQNVDVVSMSGWYDSPQGLEYNVYQDIASSREFYSASSLYANSFTTVSVDSGVLSTISGKYYNELLYARKNCILIDTLLSNYEYWCEYIYKNPHKYKGKCDWPSQIHTKSAILFDLVAAYATIMPHLSGLENLLEITPMNVIIDDKGYTKNTHNHGGNRVNVALKWMDPLNYSLNLFQQQIVSTMIYCAKNNY